MRQIGFEMLEGYPGGGFWGARRLSQGRWRCRGGRAHRNGIGEKGIEDGVLNRRLRDPGRALWWREVPPDLGTCK